MPADTMNKQTVNPADDDEKKSKGKKKKDKKNANDKKRQKKGGFPVVPVLVLLIVVGAVTALLAFNLFDIRERYVMPYLRNAPLIGGLFPPAAEPADAADGGEQDDRSVDELLGEITLQGYRIQQLEAALKTAADKNASDAETIAILREYEEQIEEYRRIKSEFDLMVAQGDPAGYAEYFASISPENQERIYREIAAELQYTEEDKRLASLYSNMSPDAAAEALEQLISRYSPLVVRIVKNMDQLAAADIMNEMTAANRATLTRLLAAEVPATTAAATAPPLP